MAYAIGTDKKDGTVQPRSTGTDNKQTVQKDIRTETKASPIKTTSTGTSDADWNKSATPNTRVGSDKKETAPAESRFSYVGHGSGIDKVERPSSGDVWAEASGGGSSSSGSSTGSRATTGGMDDPHREYPLSFGMLLDMVSTPVGGQPTGKTKWLAPTPEGSWNSPKLQERIAANGGVAPFEGVVDWAGIYDYLQAPANRRPAAQQPLDITVSGGHEWPRGPIGRGGRRGDPRLPSEPVTGSLPPSIPDPNASVVDAIPSSEVDELGRRTSEFVEPPVAVDWHNLPADQRWGWKSPFADMGRTITGALGYDDPPSMNAPGYGPESQTSAEAGIDAATQEPSTWDNTGKLLSHFGLGAIVSTLFPDMWSAGGDMMKGMFGGERGTATANGDFTRWDPREGVSVGGGSSFSWKDGYLDTTPHAVPGKGEPPVVPPVGAFPDLNHNGVDDRIEGYTGPDTKVPVVFDPPPTREVRFPDMPPYNPGRSDEWTYFTNNHLADGGIVGYAEGGAIDSNDPKVKLIGDTEDVLEDIKSGKKPDEAAAATLKAFVAQFGDGALKSLHDNVAGGMTMKSAGKGRQIKGPGGPKDDAVPAVIVEEGSVVSPAKLSNGEFVFSVDAVKGIGEGDVELGAERLQQLAERLSAGKKAA